MGLQYRVRRGARSGTLRREARCPLPPSLVAALERLAFSGLWVAIAAAALSIASAQALGIAPNPRVAATALLGTFAVYALDRLRDVDRDRLSSPRRTQFVLRHENRIAFAALLCAIGAVGLGISLGARAISLLAWVLVLGVSHRRLKRIRFAKPVYVALAWCAVVVGLPAVSAAGETHTGEVALAIGLAVLANAIASNVRDGEQQLANAARALAVARASALLSLVVVSCSPAGLRALAAIPAATLLSLLRSQIDERWGLVAVDGALVAGAVAAIALH